jgi:hypothetical protein
VRAAITQALLSQPTAQTPWEPFLDALPDYWLDSARNPKAMTPERFVVELIGPNMTALED